MPDAFLAARKQARFPRSATVQKISWAFRKALEHFRNRKPQAFSLEPDASPKGRVLFSYEAAFLVLSKGVETAIPNSHTNYWHAMNMVSAFLERGYQVDVIDSTSEIFQPEGAYSVMVDTRRNLQRLAPELGSGCVKIMHLDTAHQLFHNAAEARRLLELQQRRGITILPRRFELPNWGIETADCATTTGNAFTIGTYKYANKPIYRLPIASAINPEWAAHKDWEAARRRFLWFSSGGFVHKGLDLALDAFAQMPEYHLTVCAPLDREADFVAAYRRELFETPNITSVGWVDVGSAKFRGITDSVAAQVYTTCSEGGGACAVTCMHAGLIPIVSYEASVDVEDFGVLLNSCSVGDIKETIRRVGSLSAGELKERARKAWEYARANHTRAKFAEVYRTVVEQILDTYSARAPLARNDVRN